ISPSRDAAGAAHSSATSASVSASTAGWYQSPGRSQTLSTDAARHCSRSAVAVVPSTSSIFTPDERAPAGGHDATTRFRTGEERPMSPEGVAKEQDEPWESGRRARGGRWHDGPRR